MGIRYHRILLFLPCFVPSWSKSFHLLSALDNPLRPCHNSDMPGRASFRPFPTASAPHQVSRFTVCGSRFTVFPDYRLRAAAEALCRAGWLPIVSILRQELDSMIRSIYLLSIEDRATRNQLIEASINGKDWRLTIANGKQKKVTDRDMVELANQLQGWTESVYRFGCGFIHLSNLHDHHARDPMSLIPASEKAVILQHMRHYHGGPLQPHPTFLDLQH